MDKRVKIVLDPQIFNLQKYGGISRYYTEVFSVLLNNNKVEIIIPLNNSKNILFNQSILESIKHKLYFSIICLTEKLRLKNKLKIETLKNRYVRDQLKMQKYDLFVPTYYDPYFINYIGSKPFVLTVYDMIHELFPEYFKNDKATVVNKLALMEQATRIIAVSENTKKDILKIYPHIDSTKIDVVYHGCSIELVGLNDAIRLPENYILFVGNRGIYKNFIFFINAIVELLKTDKDLYIICAGGGSFSNIENQIIEGLGLREQIIQMDFNDEDLNVFYKKAKCFVFPSLYEGFGIPVLESMKCECPVVLSYHSSFPEVAGEAGCYFEINNADDLKNKVELLLKDENLRKEYILKGLNQVKKFSWEKAANKCYSIYKSVCNNY